MQAARGAALSEAVPEGAEQQAAGRAPVALLAGAAALVYVVDQVTKALAQSRLDEGDPVHVVGSLLELRLVHNPGAAWGIAGGATIIFSIIAVVVAVVVVRTAPRLRSAVWGLALGLLLGGAVGNLTDRVFREPGVLRGRVVDFIAFPHFPVFNVADSGITCAAVLIGLQTLRGIAPDGVRRA
ncbi:signal peptidase II [Motilibacter rhizosphaerae]|uniref:Lipoprotein signal peptidase n=1 Tax=Motilibacter rhizosphaerae TaxID=598652 RepID=A0A4Q7NG73_9ACTN|nr:signal peptidase II [Motilibacter rhizosphaerae]RZS82901.1 signal peptidase II [Motilibacter rhizosphaerae]